MHKTHIFDQKNNAKFFPLLTYLPYFFSDRYRKQTILFLGIIINTSISRGGWTETDTCQYQSQFTLLIPESEFNICILFICHGLAHTGLMSAFPVMP